MAIKNCKQWAINSEKLQAKLALPSKVLIMYLKNSNKLLLINNCQFNLRNVLRVHWQ